MLANDRNLLDDAIFSLSEYNSGIKYIRTLPDNLLNTTYSSFSDNLLLDLNMLFEEMLQQKIEQDPYFINNLKKIVFIIHKFINFPSFDNNNYIKNLYKISYESIDKASSVFLDKRIEYLMKSIDGINRLDLLGIEALRGYKGQDWSKTIKIIEAGINDPEERRLTIINLKLLKMLIEQYPYYGGSVEYKYIINTSLDFWIYHISTLIKDPARSFNFENPKSFLVKNIQDYITHEGGYIPLFNQRNLGTAISEASWREIPLTIATKLSITDERTWNNMSEDEKKEFYGDKMKLPWSDAHLYHRSPYPKKIIKNIYSKDIIIKNKLPTPKNKHCKINGFMNVVGVKGNILEKPKFASIRYLKDINGIVSNLSDRSNKEEVLKDIFKSGVALSEAKIEAFNKNDYNDSKTEYGKALIEDFWSSHYNWFIDAKNDHKPIIGGISGHTLAYLNLYRNALELKESNFLIDNAINEVPTMETLRAIMLAALIGNKRHHSYDEVMMASAGMPKVLIKGERLGYGTMNGSTGLAGYRDVFESENKHIKKAAKNAAKSALAYLKAKPDNTVLAVLKEKYPDVPLDGVYRAITNYYTNEKEPMSVKMKNALKRELSLLGVDSGKGLAPTFRCSRPHRKSQ